MISLILEMDSIPFFEFWRIYELIHSPTPLECFTTYLFFERERKKLETRRSCINSIYMVIADATTSQVKVREIMMMMIMLLLSK